MSILKKILESKNDLSNSDIDRIHIKKDELVKFGRYMDNLMVYKKNNKLYRDFVDKDTGDVETQEVKLQDLYNSFKKNKK